nr:LOW QUALITY PROTEIN: cytochrome P450 4C1-like [Cherax quadricarinatus]
MFHFINNVCKLGEVTRLWIGPHPNILISGPRATEVMLSSSRHLDKSLDYRFLHPWLGTGLLTSSGSKWHSRRKLLTPAFHFKILEDFLGVFNTQSSKLVKKLTKVADGNVFNIFPYITLCTLDIICETAMGCSVNAQDNDNSDYVKAVYRISYLVQQRTAVLWQQSDIIYWLMGYAKEHDACLKILHDFTRQTITRRRKAYEQRKLKSNEEGTELQGEKKRLAFLDLLLESSTEGGKNLTDQDIQEEVDTFMFEGHDTTTAAINWMLYLMGHHPHIQARVHEELDSIFEGTDRPATMDDIRQMKYTENCIKEALRFFPSVPYIGRHLKEDIVINEHRIPAGSTLMLVTYSLHRDPDQFPDPELFDPDRFLPENTNKRHPFAYVPFSAGPRNCIGQKFAMIEEKIIVSSILREFRVESITSGDDLQLLGELILKPKNGNLIKLFPRANQNQET